MKKIMKKALSLVLVMAMMLVPMTAWAEETQGTVDNMHTITVDESVTVSIDSGETYYFYCDPASTGEWDVTVLGTIFAPTVYLYDNVLAIPDFATDVYYGKGTGASGTFATNVMLGNTGRILGVSNTGMATDTYTITVASSGNSGPEEDLEGSYNNPTVLGVGVMQTVNYVDADYFYTWTATGTYRLIIEINPTCEDWRIAYEIYDSDDEYIDGDSESSWSNDTHKVEIDLEEGQVVKFGVGTDSYTAGSVQFVATPFDVGTIDCPANLVIGDNVADTTGAYFYRWTAELPGTITLTPGTGSKVNYSLDGGMSFQNDDYSEEITIPVEKGAQLLIVVTGSNPQVAVEAKYNPDYDGIMQDEVTTYALGDAVLTEGDNAVVLNSKADFTLFEFSADKEGYYEFEVINGAVVDNCGSPYYVYPSGNDTNTYKLEYGWAGDVYYIGVSCEDETELIVNVSYTGEIVEPTYTTYVNEVTPVSYTFEGNADNLFYVYVADGKEDVAVKDDNGVYHLGTVDGPVLYVQLGENPVESSVNLKLFAERYMLTVLDENGNYTYYDDAVNEYVRFADEETGLYPLTDDLKKVLIEYGTVNGWYDMDDLMGTYLFKDANDNVLPINEETAWLFACCYEGSVNEAATETKWTVGSEDGLKLTFNAEYRDFVELIINDKVVDETFYTAEEGSTIITISKEYLDTLATGDYEVSAVFYGTGTNDIVITTSFSVVTPVSDPIIPGTTGDSTNIALWIAVLGLGVVAIAGSVVMRKREF